MPTKLLEIQGTVLSGETWSKSYVTGSGSGLVVGGVGVGQSKTRTTTVEMTSLWVKTDSDQEVEIRVNAKEFSVRPGHRISALMYNPKHMPYFPIVAINHDTGQNYIYNDFKGYVAFSIGLLFISPIVLIVGYLILLDYPIAGLAIISIYTIFAGILITHKVKYVKLARKFVGNRGSATAFEPGASFVMLRM